MAFQLEGRRALITGAATGIGSAIARVFAEAGCAVALGFNSSRDEAEAVAEEIRAAGGRAHTVGGDLSRSESAEAVVSRAAASLGGLDILVNNAGSLVERLPIRECTPDQWRRILAVNLDSVFYCTHYSLPHLLRSTSARIVNIGSIAGQTGGGGGSIPYGTAKGAVHTFTRGLSRELASEGVTVNALAPGVIDTPFHQKFTPPARFRELMDEIPLRRPGVAEEVAYAALYLASAEAAYVTGQVLPVNGGQLTV